MRTDVSITERSEARATARRARLRAPVERNRRSRFSVNETNSSKGALTSFPFQQKDKS